MAKQTEGSHKPLIAILMAVYEPREDWLRAQLDSLEAQTYPNLKLYIRDDHSSEAAFAALKACARASIRSFPFELRRNEEKLGSNATFERLTREADGDYFAYCDQDDVWLPDKLSTLLDAIEAQRAQLVCSDMFIIDENGTRTADSITKVRRHHVFKSGEGLAPQLLIANFATGCTTLVNAGQAKAAVPFCPYMVHDHYLAVWCAARGSVVSLPQRLINYRIHANNQTTIMTGVVDKETYVEVRIRKAIRRLEWLRERMRGQGDLSAAIDRTLNWTRARERCYAGDTRARGEVWRARDLSPVTSVFDIVMAGAPDWMFRCCIGLLRRNVI